MMFAEANERNEYYEQLFKEEYGGGTEMIKQHFEMNLKRQHRKSMLPSKK